MKRIYSNYSDEEFKIVKKYSEDMGISTGLFQKYSLLLITDPTKAKFIEKVAKSIKEKVNSIPSGVIFIGKDLLNDEFYNKLSKQQKAVVGKIIAGYIGTIISLHKIRPGKINEYIKL